MTRDGHVRSGAKDLPGTVARWWLWPAPLARIAWLRAVLYAFTIWGLFVLTHDVIGHGHSPDLYQPTLIGRVLPFPDPTPANGPIMQWVLVATCLATPVLMALPQRAAQWAGRVTGWTVGLVFLAWMENSQGFAYVSHDHMALVLALLILPTVPPAGFGSQERSEAAGWVLRCVQVAVVMTYFGSALCKIVATGGLFAWPNGTVFTWALMRRGASMLNWALEYPALLRVGQWILFLVELASPVVLWLRGRWLYAAVLLFCCFHLMTWLALGIHFLPTVVCWLAFLPLERILPAARARRAGNAGAAQDAQASVAEVR
ncbi:hypothetical protein [Luteimicrobium subarcticum]|uniref:HTTM domain-containing protein n=1 Tax=Luteimicrobium subarcticum TaxID=620910 RepID=A0A2M8WSU9_9MICO|nr:hypothetical protein [Luteimicrobium subarcticum]PJI93990.1 hypothetical protein CLV34_1473 [Luteimicrobium subarcticum]